MRIKIIATQEEDYHTNLFPQTSFPISGPTAEWLQENGCEEVIPPPPIIYVPTYQDLRRIKYPPISDYVDGIVKGDQTQVQAYIDECLAIKIKYPKP